MASNKPSQSRKDFLKVAATDYFNQVPGSPAEEYLATRGIDPGVTTRFVLGYVGEPLPGHEQYQGMLAIPYLRSLTGVGRSVVSIRFRCIGDHDCKEQRHGKYLTVPGDLTMMYNTIALLSDSDDIVITEGEFDAITADALCGVPAVGIPGATNWQPWFREPFLGYETVWILADGDKPGQEFADKIARTLPNSRIIPCPPGEDVNSMVLSQGPSAILDRMDSDD